MQHPSASTLHSLRKYNSKDIITIKNNLFVEPFHILDIRSAFVKKLFAYLGFKFDIREDFWYLIIYKNSLYGLLVMRKAMTITQQNLYLVQIKDKTRKMYRLFAEYKRERDKKELSDIGYKSL